MLNQATTPDTAQGPRSTSSPGAIRIRLRKIDLVGIDATLQARLRSIAARLQRSVPQLDDRDSRFLSDLQREDVRYRMRALVRLSGIAARSPLPHHRESVSQMVREITVAQQSAGAIDVDRAFDQETDAQGAFDKAQLHYSRQPSPENHARVIAAGHEQLATTQVALDALYARSRHVQ